MAGESTNNPAGQGGNPGRPPSNDQGTGTPNPAPPPPSSLPPDPKMVEAGRTFDEIVTKNDKLRATVDQLNSSLKNTLAKEEEYRKKIAESAAKEQRLMFEREKKKAELDEKYAKFRKADGTWHENTSKIQKDYSDGLSELDEQIEATRKEFVEGADAINSLKKAMLDEVESRKKVLAEIRRDAREIDRTVVGIEEDIEQALDKTEFAISEMAESLSKLEKGVAEEVEKTAGEEIRKVEEEKAEFIEALKKKNREEGIREEMEAFERRMQEEEKARERMRKADLLAGEERSEEQGKALSAQMLSTGGVVGLGDIKEEIDAIADAEMKRFEVLNPDATEEQTRAYREDFMLRQKGAVLDRLKAKQEKELLELRKSQISEIVKEKKVSVETATKIAAGGDFKKAQDALKDRHAQTIKSLESIKESQLNSLYYMKAEDAKAAEREAEAFNDVPAWAQRMIDSYVQNSEAIKETLGDIFKKESSWFTTIIMILGVVIGATVGYIYTYVQKVFGVVSAIMSFIPGLGKMFGGLGAGVGGFFAKFGQVFMSVEKGLGGIAKAIPFIGNFLSFAPRLMGALRMGFTLASKLFWPITILISTIDAIIGAFKGYARGGIQGAIAGAISGIISGLTFGLVKFDVLFKFFSEGISNFVNFFKYLFTGDFRKLGELVVNMVLKNLKFMFDFLVMLPIRIGVWLSKTLYNIFMGFLDLRRKAIDYLSEAMLGIWKYLTVEVPAMLKNAFYRAVFYFVSGQFTKDLISFKDWLISKLIDFFLGIIRSLADALGEIPVVGGYLKAALGGGTPPSPMPDPALTEAASEQIREARKTAMAVASAPSGAYVAMSRGIGPQGSTMVPVVVSSSGVQAAAMSNSYSYSSSMVGGAASNTTMARYEANRSQPVVVSAPTTNVVGAGGGSDSQPSVLTTMGRRNDDPTIRALMLLEAPAL